MSKSQRAPDPHRWAAKLREAAAELRRTAHEPSFDRLGLAQRLERRAQVVLFPQLPRWWAEPTQP